MNATVSARLHAILAREADRAVVFRRGPSDRVAVIGWNLADDTFSLGQWFRGRIYGYRCDLSPDGRYLVYFAAKYGRTNPVDERIKVLIREKIGERPPFTLTDVAEAMKCFHKLKEFHDSPLSPEGQYDPSQFLMPESEYDRKYAEACAEVLREHAEEFEQMRRSPDYQDASWTAISEAPYLKALDLWFNGSGWNGGGIFTDNSHVWINQPLPFRGTHIQTRCSGLFTELASPPSGWGAGGECPGIYLPKLERDGWICVSESDTDISYEKKLTGSLRLQKIFHVDQPDDTPGYGVYWEEHKVFSDQTLLLDGADWCWADFDAKRRRILFAKAGAIYACKLDALTVPAVLLHDFNAMKFEPTAAPEETAL